MSANVIVGAQGEGEDEEKKDGPETDEDILAEARDRYRISDTFETDNHKDAKDDLLFLSGGINQWDPIDAQIRTAQRRPMITVNNLPTFLHQVTNDLRQNKLGGRVHPVDDNTDPETAEVVQGMIRHIEYDSNASVATGTAVNSAASVGFGYYRLVTEYESEDSFDQKIMFKRIRNALAVHMDPLSQEIDGSDMKYCFVDSLEDRAEFKKEHPKAKANNADLIGQDIYSGWFTEHTVLVTEYYRIKTTEAILCELMDGTKGWKADLPPGSPPILRERTSQRCVVEWFKLTGVDILDRTIIKCKWIPVFPVYGDEIDIDGKVIRSGVIRHAKDSFKMYNVCITTAIEEVATRAKSPYIMGEGQDEGHEAQWANINRIPYASVKYKPTTVGDLLVPPPMRQPMADIPAGWLSMTMHFADNKKATTGLFDSSLGAKGTATSGIQEREQQQQGDIANLHYSDNLKTTYRHTLRCIVNMLPHYYDGARTVRMLGEDEDVSSVQVNQPIEQKNPKTQAIETVTHDLTIGEFDITVAAGPAHSTKRQEAAEFLTDAMQAAKDPAQAGVLTYLAIKNQDLPGAEEATKMLKKLLPPGIAEPEEDEEPVVNTPHGPMPISKVGAMIEQMGMALQNADKQLDQADADGKQAEAQKQANVKEDLRIKNKDSEIKAYEAETARKAMEAKAQADLEQVQVDAIKAEEARLKAEADIVRANTEACTAADASEKEKQEKEAAPKAASVEDIAKLLESSRPKLGGMEITAPSGGKYAVKLH